MFDRHVIDTFYQLLDGRLLDMATEPGGMLLTPEGYETWLQTRSLRHCRTNIHVRAAASAAWQDATNTTYDPDGVKDALFEEQIE